MKGKSLVILLILLVVVGAVVCAVLLGGGSAGIEASYDSQGNTVYEGSDVENLRQNLTVYSIKRFGEKEEITDYTLSGTLSVGDCTVTVAYGEYTTTFKVTVAEKEPVSISALYQQGSTIVYESASLDSLKQSLVLTVTNNDGTTFETTDYTLFGELVAGESEITVVYGDFSDTFYVNVTQASAVSVSALYQQGSNIVYATTDLENLKQSLILTVTNDDGTSFETTDYTLSGTLEAGVSTITATYGTLSTTFTVNVTAADPVSVSLQYQQGSKVVYTSTPLESLKQDLLLTVTNNDGTTFETSDYTLSGTLTEGQCTITLTYGTLSETFTVNVAAVAPVSLVAEYQQGANIVYTSTPLYDLKQNLVVSIVNNDGSTVEITDYTLAGILTAGEFEVTVSFETFTTTFTVNVTAVAAVSVSAQYQQGTDIIYTSTPLHHLKQKLVVTVTNNDGSTFETTDYTLSGALTAGESTITLSYDSISTTFKVNATAVVPVAAEITTLPMKTHYIETERVDLAGLVFTVEYNDGSRAPTSGYTCSKEHVSAQDEEITISYDRFTASFKITVERKIVSLSITSNPHKTSYIVGERLDLAGLVITATYLDQTSATVEAVSSIANGAFLPENAKVTFSLQGITTELALQVAYKEYMDFKLSYVYEPAISNPAQEVVHFEISKYVGKTLKLAIPEACEGVPISAIGNNAFHNCDLLMIKIGNNITKVYSDTFKGCADTVLCLEASEAPETWAEDWNAESAPVVWAFHSMIIDDYFSYGVVQGKVYITGYKGLSPVVVIPETIDDMPVASVCSAFSENEILTHIILPDTLEEIGDYAFASCANLKIIAIPASVARIGVSAFDDCISLKKLMFVGTSQLQSIGERAFYSCEMLTSISIPASVTSIASSAFYSCDNLTSVTFAEGCQLQSIGDSVFGFCEKLESITIPASVKNIGSAVFYLCGSLTNIVVAQENAAYQTIDGNLYSKDGKTLVHYAIGKTAESFEVPAFVTTISAYAFSYCNSLVSVTFAEGSQLQSIDAQAFFACVKLTSVAIPASLLSIGDSAFASCRVLASISIPASVTSIDASAFRSCSSLTNITVAKENAVYQSIDGNLYSKDGKTLLQYAIGKTDTSFTIPGGVQTISDYAFYACSALKEIAIPASVTSIASYAFSDCNSLTDVTFTEDSQLKSIGEYAFSSCSNLTSISIPVSVMDVGNQAFKSCDSLKRIVCASKYRAENCWNVSWKSFCDASVVYLTEEKEVETHPDYNYIVVAGEAILTKYKGTETNVTIPEVIEDLYTVVSFGNVFQRSSVTQIVIPASVTSISASAFSSCNSLVSVTFAADSQLQSIGDNAFSMCEALESIIIPASVTSIGSYAFKDCSHLASITVAQGNAAYQSIDGNLYSKDDKTLIQYAIGKTAESFEIPASVINVADYAFYRCKNLKSITFAEGSQLQSIGVSAFYECVELENVAIPASVTTIGDSAFFYCNSLVSITFAEGSQLQSIGSNAFSYCNSMESFTIPASVTSIGSYAFRGCSALAELDIPQTVLSLGENVVNGCSALRKIILPVTVDNLSGDFFGGCSQLSEIYIRQGNELYRSIEGNLYSASGEILIRYMSNADASVFVVPSTVTKISDGAFSGCEYLTRVFIPSSVTTIGSSAFSGCSNLRHITIPASVTSIGYSAFSSCKKLTSVTFAADSQLQSISFGIFKGCSALKNITIPASVIGIDSSAFSMCSGLTDITFAEDNQLQSIGDDAFEMCAALKSITIPASVTSIGYSVFEGCSSLTSVAVAQENTAYQSINGNLYSKDGKTLIQYAIGKTATSFQIPSGVEIIGDCAFSGCDYLTSVAIPASVTSIGCDAFRNCSNLTGILIPASVTSIGASAFEWCLRLASVTFAEGSQLQSIGMYAFSTCSALESITIPASVMYVESSAFSSCSHLASIICASQYRATYCWDANWKFDCDAEVSYLSVEEEITTHPEYNYFIVDGEAILTKYKGNATIVNVPATIDAYQVVDFGEIFRNSNLTQITIPASVKAICAHAFNSCASLTSVTFAENSQLQSIGASAFFYCNNLVSIALPASVQSIGEYAFSDCSKLERITIPASVITIGNAAFSLCSGLVDITFAEGSQLQSIGDGAFEMCEALKSITIPASVTSIGLSAFEGCSNLATITVAQGNAAYQSIDGNLYSKDGKTLICYAIGKTATSFAVPATVTSIASSAFSSCKYLHSITIPASVTTIGSYAFELCSYLVSVTFAEGSQLQSIGSFAFYSCLNLTSITFVGGSQLQSIDDSAFSYCDRLASITISASATSIGSKAFDKCSKLYIFFEGARCDIDFAKDWNPDGRPTYFGTTIYQSTADFYCETSANTATIIKYIGNGGAVIIPDEITIGGKLYTVTKIAEEAFADMLSVTSIKVGANVSYIASDAFRGCKNLEVLQIDQSNIHYKVEGGILYTADGKELVAAMPYISGTVNVLGGVEIIHSQAFTGCNRITSISVPASVHTIASMAFNACADLQEIVVNGENSEYATVDGILFSKDMTTIYAYPEAKEGAIYAVPDTVTFIDSHCFTNASVSFILVPNGGVEMRDTAFGNKQKVIFTVNIYANNAISTCVEDAIGIVEQDGLVYVLQNEGHAVFVGYVGALESVSIASTLTVDGTDYTVVEIASNAFYACSNLKSVTISESVTSINSYAFFYCVKLESVSIPAFVTSVGYNAFYGCLSLTVYCEADSQPSDWSENWNAGDCPVVWGSIAQD